MSGKREHEGRNSDEMGRSVFNLAALVWSGSAGMEGGGQGRQNDRAGVSPRPPCARISWGKLCYRRRRSLEGGGRDREAGTGGVYRQAGWAQLGCDS